MSLNEKFCLKWDDFQQNISTSLRELRSGSDFSDVTLVSEDGQHIEAHRIILSASSKLFMNMLNKNSHSHPMIYMKGLSEKYLQAILDFIYSGEVSIVQDDLEKFLALAEELQLNGLSGGNSKNDNIIYNNEELKTINEPNFTMKTTSKPKSAMLKPSFEQDFIGKIKDENIIINKSTFVSTINELNTSVVSIEDNSKLDEQIILMMDKVQGEWICSVCGITKVKKDHMMSHIESNHIEASHPCSICGKISRSRVGLRIHMKQH